MLVIKRASAVNDKFKVIDKLQGTAHTVVVTATEIDRKFYLSFYFDSCFSVVKYVDAKLCVSSAIATITRFVFNTAIKIDQIFGLVDKAIFLISFGVSIIADRMVLQPSSSSSSSSGSSHNHQHTE